MAISVLRRPYERNWSGNPISYTLYSAAAEADATNYFEIRIRFKRTDEADFYNVIALPIRPVNGSAQFDIKDILDGMMEYELPYLPPDDEFGSPYASKKMTGKFYLQWREITTAAPDPAWVDTETANQLFIIKGGISFHKWRGDNYWTNYFDNLLPFLGWEKNHALHSLTERMYLAWLNLTDVSEGDIKMKRTIHYTDGVENVAYLNCPISKYNVCYFPSGGSQLELEEVDPTKNIYWWEMQVVKTATNPYEPLSEAFRYYADNKVDYNAITLNFRGSLGNIGSARVKGVIDYTANRSFTDTERVVLHNYFEEHFVKARIGAENSSEIQVLKGDLGYLGKEEQERMRDLHFRREVWWEQQLKWLPVQMLTASNRQKTSEDKRFAMPIEFCIAAGEEFFYTPESVNLAEAAAVTELACNAVINTLASNYVPGTGWVISWVLASGGPPVKYQVSTPAVSGGAPGETITTDYTIVWLPVGDNVVTVRPVCSIGGVLYLGAAEMITVTVEEACVHVGISGEPILLPDAIAGIAYNYVINLTGTAPFSIGSITKPAWMSIAVVGSTVTITGTPSGGDVATGVTVAFALSNCAGAGSEVYTYPIDVLAAAGNGDFVAANETTGLNYIEWIRSSGVPFYSISSGEFPLMEGLLAIGNMAAGITAAISVRVVISSLSISLELWKNGVAGEVVSTPGTGTYSFAPVTFLITDDIEIKLRF